MYALAGTAMCTCVSRKGWRERRGDRSWLRPAEMIAFRVTMQTHTDTRARTLVSANIDGRKHARIFTRMRIVRLYSQAITFVRASAWRMERQQGGCFNIPTVYLSGSVDIGYRRKITSILVNTSLLHARNNTG